MRIARRTYCTKRREAETVQHPVRIARKGKLMTQNQLAAVSGVDASMISRIERGEDGRLRTYRFLGRALGIDYRLLLPADTGDGDQAQ